MNHGDKTTRTVRRCQAFFDGFTYFPINPMDSVLYGQIRPLVQEGVERPVGWTVGDVARKLRKRRRISAEKMAEKAGINKSTLGSFERSTRSPDTTTVEAVAGVLGLTVQTLYAMVPVTVSADVRELLLGMTRLEEINPKAASAFRIAMAQAIDEAIAKSRGSKS